MFLTEEIRERVELASDAFREAFATLLDRPVPVVVTVKSSELPEVLAARLKSEP